jgi:hypothetical protein
LILAAGQDLVYVALVTGVEDDRIARRVEDPMHGQRELDDSEIGPQMATGLRYMLDQEGADF